MGGRSALEQGDVHACEQGLLLGGGEDADRGQELLRHLEHEGEHLAGRRLVGAAAVGALDVGDERVAQVIREQ